MITKEEVEEQIKQLEINIASLYQGGRPMMSSYINCLLNEIKEKRELLKVIK
jgi:hypothetical protein